ncbi:helix-turn-helix transcriptional regulator [Thiothrix lacustris]|jgi:predicted DNA-binding transcriptional regulator AlpA|uniref:helix-turn-helix transcriptional regulator n=1 Tax=Thiothrix lacustris TaxID=525917 RepID=UPI0027E5B0F7|nr:helix-turn-helix domain-containing protein [Thiothrix lacustris]WMP16961.1 helix-turn-helix domain-containing protein [Thiothrix lacustris]
MEQMHTVKEVAILFKLSTSSIWRLTKEGKLPPPVKIGLKATRWKQSELEEFIGAMESKGD